MVGNQPVRKLLKQFGFQSRGGETTFRSWEALPHLALLAIKWRVEKERPVWHWVVFLRDANGAGVLDSKNLCAIIVVPTSAA